MALEETDLFVAQRPADNRLFKLQSSVLQLKLPDGDVDNQILEWNGATWVPGTADGGVYATTKEGIVSSVGIDVVGTGYPNGIVEYGTTAISGNGYGLTVEVRYSADTWTPGYLFVKSGGQGYEVGDQLKVLGGNHDKLIEVITVFAETQTVEGYF